MYFKILFFGFCHVFCHVSSFFHLLYSSFSSTPWCKCLSSEIHGDHDSTTYSDSDSFHSGIPICPLPTKWFLLPLKFYGFRFPFSFFVNLYIFFIVVLNVFMTTEMYIYRNVYITTEIYIYRNVYMTTKI